MLFPFCVFQTIMKDRWMNMGFEEEELLPFKEPTLDISDQKRIEMLVTMGYPRTEVEESLRLHKFDDTYASYLLLGRKSTDVSTHHNNNSSTYNMTHFRQQNMASSLLSIYKKCSILPTKYMFFWIIFNFYQVRNYWNLVVQCLCNKNVHLQKMTPIIDHYFYFFEDVNFNRQLLVSSLWTCQACE